MTKNQKHAIMLMQMIRPDIDVTVSYNTMSDILEFKYNSLNEGKGVIVISPTDEDKALSNVTDCVKIIRKIIRSLRKHE